MLAWQRKILWRRALDWLATYQPVVIAVTGTYGKSTAAAAITRVVGSRLTVRWTPAVPAGRPHAGADPAALALAILGVTDDPRRASWYYGLTKSFVREIAAEEPAVVIVEVPAERPSDIDWIAKRLQPDITVVTNVGSSNLELFGSKENVAHEISSLVAATKKTGTVVVNYDDELTRAMPTLSRAPAITFGTAAADVQLARATRVPAGGFALEIKTHRETAEVLVPHVVARHQLLSLVAALAVGHALNIPLSAAAKELHQFEPLPGRTCLLPGRQGSTIIDDSANATPESMHQALETLRALSSRRPASSPARPAGGAGRRIAVLGDIANLGRFTEKIHRGLGRGAAQTANMLIAVGESMRWAGAEALPRGIDVHHFDTADDAAKWLSQFLKTDDTILISGGRDMQLGRLVERLTA